LQLPYANRAKFLVNWAWSTHFEPVDPRWNGTWIALWVWWSQLFMKLGFVSYYKFWLSHHNIVKTITSGNSTYLKQRSNLQNIMLKQCTLCLQLLHDCTANPSYMESKLSWIIVHSTGVHQRQGVLYSPWTEHLQKKKKN